MSSSWAINGETVDCEYVRLGICTTDSAKVFVIDDSAPCATGDLVTLTCDGQAILYGEATVYRGIAGADDRTSVEIAGFWRKLEATTYQQNEAVAVSHAVDEEHPRGYALSTILSPEVTLGMDDDGDPLTTLQEANAIGNYAIAAGVPIAIDFDFDGQVMQPVKGSSISCADALRTVLHFHPDVILFFEYGSATATLKAVKVEDMTPIDYPRTGAGERVQSADFREDLNYRPEGVRIIYTRTSVWGLTEANLDTAGSFGSNGKAPYVINHKINLEGQDPPPLQQQRVRTRPIPSSFDPLDPEGDEVEGAMNYYQNFFEWLREPGVAEIITISEHLVTVDPANITESDDPSESIPTTWSTDPDDYPRMLIDGTLPPWLDFKSAPVSTFAKFTLGEIPEDMDDSIKEMLGRLFSGGSTITRKTHVTGTDASTREYTAPAFLPEPPDWPAGGIASAYYLAFQAAAWGGDCVLVAEDQPRAVIGTKVNVSGYQTGWESMEAVVREVNYNPSDHSTTIQCSPPDNFGFTDFLELSKLLKKGITVDPRSEAQRRTQAVPNASGKVQGAGMTARSSTSTDDKGGGGVGFYPWQTTKEAAGLAIRVYPGIVMDGEGNDTIPTIVGTPIEIDSFYDIDLPTGVGTGYLYIECGIDNSDDVHGIITSAAIKVDFDSHTWNEEITGDKALFQIAYITSDGTTFSHTPIVFYNPIARRYGPPGSASWAINPY